MCVNVLELVISVRDDHCDFSPRTKESLATPLPGRETQFLHLRPMLRVRWHVTSPSLSLSHTHTRLTGVHREQISHCSSFTLYRGTNLRLIYYRLALWHHYVSTTAVLCMTTQRILIGVHRRFGERTDLTVNHEQGNMGYGRCQQSRAWFCLDLQPWTWKKCVTSKASQQTTQRPSQKTNPGKPHTLQHCASLGCTTGL